MNIKQAKRIPIQEFLERHGHLPCRSARGALWYASPFRAERTPSFKVNCDRQLWYDFGLGTGGDILELAKRLFSVNTIREALAYLDSTNSVPRAAVLPSPLKPTSSNETELELIDLGPLRSQRLQSYLGERGIALPVAAAHVQEMRYRRGRKNYSALAFANDSGGYELRNPSFKGTFRKKDLTTITRSAERVFVFEGFFDFLTALSCFDGTQDASIIVLNSASMKDRAIHWLRQRPNSAVELFFDHDDTGRQLVTQFRDALSDRQLIDNSDTYAGYKDLNAWHVAGGDNPRPAVVGQSRQFVDLA